MRRHPSAFRLLVVSGIAAIFLCAPAFADELADATALYQSRQYTEALNKADAYLKRNPRDARMRFLKGLIFTETGRRNDAIELFNALTAEYPTMPEPYNNLAVLYASNGQYDNARAALEKAIRANPGYTRGYENLGDIYLTLAIQRYNTALQQEPDNSQVRLKYLMARSALENPGENMPKAASRPAPLAAGAATNQSQAPVAAAAPAASSAAQANATTSAASAATAAPAAKPADAAGDRDAVLSVLNDWTKAWSGKDVARYLGVYSPAFRPAGSMSRSAWEAQRRARLSRSDSIAVTVDAPEVTVKGRVATVRFRQHYVSGHIDSNERKKIVMEKTDGQWKIVQERSGG